jgi:succinate-acetate transporter protein
MAEETLGIEERLAKLEEKVASHKHADAGVPIANPAPLGLFAFGLTTLMLNLVNAELVEKNTTSLVLGYGMFYGGLCQIFAGLWEFRKNNTFGATAFTSYGAFWMGLAFWHLLADADIWNPSSSFKGGFASILAVWGMFTGLMFVGTLKINRALQAVFLTLTILFFLLAAGQYNPDVHRIAGYEGILCAFTAIYAAWAQVINEVWGKVVLPLGPVKK